MSDKKLESKTALTDDAESTELATVVKELQEKILLLEPLVKLVDTLPKTGIQLEQPPLQPVELPVVKGTGDSPLPLPGLYDGPRTVHFHLNLPAISQNEVRVHISFDCSQDLVTMPPQEQEGPDSYPDPVT